MKIKDKFIQCEACHKKYTINYLEKDEIKKEYPFHTTAAILKRG